MNNNMQELQMLEYQAKELQKVIGSINNQLAEINNTAQALKDFKAVKKDDEILLQIASGIFVRGKVIDTETLKINIGSNVAVDKSIDETINMMNLQLQEMEKYKLEVDEQFQKIIGRLNESQ